MKCIFCKANIDDNASVCPYCDSSLVTNVGTTSTVEPVVEQPTPALQTPVQPVQTPVVVTPVRPVVQPVQTPVQVVSPTLETPPNVEMVTPKK